MEDLLDMFTDKKEDHQNNSFMEEECEQIIPYVNETNDNFRD